MKVIWYGIKALQFIAGFGVAFLGGILVMGGTGWDCTGGIMLFFGGMYLAGDALERKWEGPDDVL